VATATQTSRALVDGRRDAAPRASVEDVVAVPAPSSDLALTDRPARSMYRCECGYTLRVIGGGRHRVYFTLADTGRFDDPVMNRVCPGCGQALPGKNGPS
jgi:hypothetical protein